MPEFHSDDEVYLMHYGIKRKSGRYPWGSGKDAEGRDWGDLGSDTAAQRSMSFFQMVDKLEAEGLTRPQIAKGLGFDSSTELRQAVTIARNAERTANQDKAVKLREKGWGASAIGREMGLSESSVRQLLNPSVQERTRALEATANMLREEMTKGGYLDIGKGSEFYVNGGITKEKLAASVAMLKDEGFVVHKVQVDQPGTQNKTTYRVLCPEGTTYKDVVTDLSNIRTLTPHTEDGGQTWSGKPLPPMPISSDRVAVVYKEDGGDKSDGVMYVREGVKDLSLGGASYAQVRVNVDGTHYLKGMAVYSKDLPDGVDILFNTNKPKGTPKLGPKTNTVLKPLEDDPDLPFGAMIRRQIKETGPDGKERLTSAMNLLNEEGTWDTWSRDLSSQVLSKQSPKLAKQLLDKTYDKKRQELDEILALTNPTVRAKLLDSFSDSADSSAVHLSAAGMPRSSYHVILPFNGLKDTEIYAPNYENGEKVALIRYPHGGKFEIPELTVNNNHPPAKAQIGRAPDAVGINAKVAERMSGADFDGDFVMVIPNNTGAIKSESALKALEGFNPQKYKLPDDAPRMTARQKGTQMGDVSNLITDMTIKGATNDEIARAVKHSMVVIDAEKHHLDYKKSAFDNGIPALKAKYQRGENSGADTLISLATSEQRVNKRKASRTEDGGPINKATGKLQYTETGESYTTSKVMKRTGEVRETVVMKKQSSTKLYEADDAHTLSSGTVMEKVYADHSNKLKALANESRRVMVNSPDGVPVSDSAKKVYASEVKQLNAKLKIAEMNSPRERQALVIATAIIAQKRADRPDMDAATLKKVKSQALTEARLRAGAKKELVEITDREWDAIQAGAITKTMLKRILENTDIEKVKEMATPRIKPALDGNDMARARLMVARGLTQAEIASALGVSVTTLKRGLD